MCTRCDTSRGDFLNLQFRRQLLCIGHELLPSVDDPIELVEDSLRLDRAPFEPCPVDGEPLPHDRLVRSEQVADLVERDLERAQAPDRLRHAGLLQPVVAVAGPLVDASGLEQADLVVVPESLDRQSRDARERADREFLGELHAAQLGASR
jgi:hypothetical protein